MQATLFIPSWIQAGIDDGSLFRSGSVVRRVAGGSIAKHLDEIPRPEQVVEEAAKRAAKVNPKIMVPVVMVTAVGAGAAVVIKKRKKADRHNVVTEVRADVPQCVGNFEASLRAYVDAGRDGILDAEIVDRLITDLDEVKAWADNGNTIEFLFEPLEPLFRLVIQHTLALARAYSRTLADTGPQASAPRSTEENLGRGSLTAA